MILAAAAWGVASMLAAENQYHFRMNIDRARIVGWLVLACGSLILCSLRLWQLYRQLPKYRRSDRVVRQRRLSQLSVILIGFGIFALPLLVNAYALAVKGLMQVQSLPPLCLLGVAVAGMAVFFPSFEQVASAQTAAFPQAEAERLALTLSRRDLEAWAAVERRTVSCELDLRGATALTIYLGTDLQTLMDLLRERATADFAQYGEVLLDRKPMGDAVIIIMEVAGDASLAEATRKMVALLRARLPVYWSLVQDVYRALATASALAELPPAEIYVHAKVLAVSSMSFAVPNGRRDDPRLDTILSRYDLSSWRKQASSSRDFTAAEINHYLKFVGKAQKGHITLCMPRAEVEDLDQLDNLRSLSDLVDAYLRAEKGLEPAAIAQDPMVRYLASKDLVTATVPLSPQAKIKKPPRGAA
jgi:hypothetical protein